jgi:hypothetical protein
MPTALSRMRLIAFAHSSAGMTEEDWGTVTRHQHLAQADRLIADCLDRIARQREVITTEYEQGLPTDIAESMLPALEESLRAFEKHRQYIVNRLIDAERS